MVSSPIFTLTAAPGSAVPLRVGVVLLAILSPATPLSLPASIPPVVADTVVSTVNGVPTTVVLPPCEVVAVIIGVYVPSGKLFGTVMLHVPSEPTVVVIV